MRQCHDNNNLSKGKQLYIIIGLLTTLLLMENLPISNRIIDCKGNSRVVVGVRETITHALAKTVFFLKWDLLVTSLSLKMVNIRPNISR